MKKSSPHGLLNRAIATNKIIKPEVCSMCGCRKRIVGHHNDYCKPLDVIWVCYSCHRKIHSILGKAKNHNLIKFAVVTVTHDSAKRLVALRERFRPQFKATAFLGDIMDVYEKSHCPECGGFLTYQTCSCKAPERL